MSAFDHYVCEGQMSIFDMLPSGDFTEMSMAEIADEIGRAIGHKFKPDERWEGYWYFKYRGFRFEIMRSKYAEGCVPTTNHTADGSFIGAHFEEKNGGGGGPCDSIDEAVAFFRKKLKNVEANA